MFSHGKHRFHSTIDTCFYFFFLQFFYKLLLSGNAVSGGHKVSLNKGKKIKMLSFIEGQIESVWLRKCV